MFTSVDGLVHSECVCVVCLSAHVCVCVCACEGASGVFARLRAYVFAQVKTQGGGVDCPHFST